MKQLFVVVLLVTFALVGCNGNKNSPEKALSDPLWQDLKAVPQKNVNVYDQQMLGSDSTSSVYLLAAGNHGLQLQRPDGSLLDQLKGKFESVDSRPLVRDRSQWLATSVDESAQRVIVTRINVDSTSFVQSQSLPERPFGIENVCLFQDRLNHNYLFLVGEDGIGEQWLVGNSTQLLQHPLHVRSLSFPPQSTNCRVDDLTRTLFVNEESIGLWAYSAEPEAESVRVPIDMVAPFGNIEETAGNLAVMPGVAFLVDPDAQQLHLYQYREGHWKRQSLMSLQGVTEAEQIQLHSASMHQLSVDIRDDASGNWYRAVLEGLSADVEMASSMASVKPLTETKPIGYQGDAADDPAIWVAPNDASRSLILGTNKKAGLEVYDLAGKRLQQLNIGRLNNVDVRSDIKLGEKSVDIAAASNRDLNSLSLFTIDRESRAVSFAGNISTPMEEIYGFCLYQPEEGQLYAFANDKNGLVVQYQISADFNGKEVRRFKLESQPEGCVADDKRRRLYIGEEDVGVWVINADPVADTKLEKVIAVGDLLKDDVEGLGLYHDRDSGESLLVVSSQGDDSYVVIETDPPYKPLGKFQVGVNVELGIDGASETDGLEVSSVDFGKGWERGMLVVQDGRNRMPDETQNFKLVPWSAIEEQLQY